MYKVSGQGGRGGIGPEWGKLQVGCGQSGDSPSGLWQGWGGGGSGSQPMCMSCRGGMEKQGLLRDHTDLRMTGLSGPREEGHGVGHSSG